MTIKIFGTTIILEPELNWFESSNCNITSKLDVFRELESDDTYMYAIQDNIVMAMTTEDMEDGESSMYFLDLETDECKHVQNHKFLYIFERIIFINK
jgi:hypothetical protein